MAQSIVYKPTKQYYSVEKKRFSRFSSTRDLWTDRKSAYNMLDAFFGRRSQSYEAISADGEGGGASSRSKPRTFSAVAPRYVRGLPAAQHCGRLLCVCLQAGGSHRAQARATTHAQDTLRRNQTYQSPNRHRALRLNSPSTPVVASSRRSLSLSLTSPLPMSPSRRRYPRHATRTQRGVTQRGAQLTRSAQIKSCSARAGSLAY